MRSASGGMGAEGVVRGDVAAWWSRTSGSGGSPTAA